MLQQQGFELGSQTTQVDATYRKNLAQARVKEAAGDLRGALEALAQARSFYVRTPIPYLRPVEAMQARIYLKQGMVGQAQEWAQQSGLALSDDPVYLHEFEYLTLVRLVLAEDRGRRNEQRHTEIRELLARLLADPSPAAQVRASVLYNMIVEGVLAETGYYGYFTILQRKGLMPGQVQGIQLLKQDELRHIAYGIYLISRLIAVDPDLWQVAEEAMNELLPMALGVVGDLFEQYDPVPFGLEPADFTDFAVGQFQKRLERLEKARGASLAEIDQMTMAVIEQDDA